MTNYTLDNKIFWVRNFTTEKTHEDSMYPSLSKQLKKKLPLLQSFFEYHLEPLTALLIDDIFAPLYKKYVASKEHFKLNEQELPERLKERLETEPHKQYYILWVTKKGDSSVIYGATVFNIATRGDVKTCSFAYKGYDHAITRELKIGVSIDVWTESLIQDFALENDCVQLRHGKDTHFREKPGLHLFKLKTGCLPLSALTNTEIEVDRSGLEQITISEDDIQKNDLSVFFAEPGTNGFYTQMHLFRKLSADNSELCGEFQKIGERSGLEVILTEY